MSIVATGIPSLEVAGYALSALSISSRSLQSAPEAAAVAFERVKPYSGKKKNHSQSSLPVFKVDCTTDLAFCARTASFLHFSDFTTLAAEILSSGYR